MHIKTFIIDAFTAELFKGNQAAVCLIPMGLSESLMLSIAKEFGFSETAFVMRKDTAEFAIRYFSPVQEIPLCGHATMASSKALFFEFPELSKITFQTKLAGDLTVVQRNGKIEMSFPLHPTEACGFDPELSKTLGISEVQDSRYNVFHNMLLLQMESSEDLEKLQPDFIKLKTINTSLNGVLVTAKSSRADFDYEYRYFFPWSGADEDPVTGGVQSFLAKYWSEILGKNTLNAFQCSSRTGSMEVEIVANSVSIRSDAVIFSSGELHLS
ncbi:PhzF family phenazine biosynthesis protein [Algoriphagus halophytocola]|uniref:PhzF family phenazine biosynthesis protein n=1 Tax=Algoriphagus halophytocola TaxID=2991499 RepID=A0ABY6MIH7_9BACT|nr:PhzF family phenazine biosynthesis protein [Algoriphagus sp. TR-M5]UZD23433.1 PhzF family phenazine biosynthesis protein [Algoriphagus sp. TR-M5]